MYYIGLDIGGTKCASTLGKIENDTITILKKDFFLTANQDPAIILNRFASFIEECLKEVDISGIGISCGGPLDSKRGVIMAPPSLPLWDNIEIVKYFEEKFHIPTRLQNDANACAVAEWKYGAGKGATNMAFLTFGTGFGAGLILDGKLYSGTNDNAGEIGHIRLTNKGPIGYHKEGSCEGYCSGSGMVRLAKIMSKQKSLKESYLEYVNKVGEENISAKTMYMECCNGNKFCKAVFKKSGEMLGKSLSIIVDLLNVERIVIGGIYMRATDVLYPQAIKVMKKECLSFSLDQVEILHAKLSENIGDMAALSLAKGEY